MVVVVQADSSVILCCFSVASLVAEEEETFPDADIAVFNTFLRQHALILQQYPLLLPQLAANQPLDSPLCCQAPQLSRRWQLQHMVRWLNKPQTVGSDQRSVFWKIEVKRKKKRL